MEKNFEQNVESHLVFCKENLEVNFNEFLFFYVAWLFDYYHCSTDTRCPSTCFITFFIGVVKLLFQKNKISNFRFSDMKDTKTVMDTDLQKKKNIFPQFIVHSYHHHQHSTPLFVCYVLFLVCFLKSSYWTIIFVII